MEIDNNSVLKTCPLCYSAELKSDGEIVYPREIFFSTEKIELKREAKLFSCCQCKSKFVQNRVPENVAYNLYKNSSSNNRWGNKAALEETKNKEVIDNLLEFFDKDKLVVDVGCNTGLLLDLAKKRGAETIGIELSHNSKSILLSKGHKVYNSLDKIDDDSVNVITAFDLVEHLYDVNAFIEICNRKLIKGGLLVVLTGNSSCLSAGISGKHWWYSCYPEHIVFPSLNYYKSLKKFSLYRYIKTYASKGYDLPKPKIGFILIKILIKSLLRSYKYNGLPSIGPDHHLVVLKK